MSRQHPRVRTRLTATVRLAGSERMIVCPTRDVSLSGCFLETADDIALGTRLTLAVMDLDRGEVIELAGRVARRAQVQEHAAGPGIGVRLDEATEAWQVLVDRQRSLSSPSLLSGSSVRLRILVVGDADRRRGALALYVTSGWDVRFASDLDGTVEALESVQLSAVIAEHNLDDPRWTEVLAATRRLQPNARRIVRCGLDGQPAPETDPSKDLVHRVVDLDAGMDSLLDALTADLAAGAELG